MVDADFLSISSRSKLLPNKCSPCVHYITRHHKSIFSRCKYQFHRRWPIWIRYILWSKSALQAMHASFRIDCMFKSASFGDIHAGIMILGPYDAAWYTDCNRSNCVAIFQLLMQWHTLSVHHENRWYIIPIQYVYRWRTYSSSGGCCQFRRISWL